MSDARRIIVGVGNHFRGDDRAGLDVAERVRGRVPDGTEIVLIEGDPTPLLDILARSELVLIVDAVESFDDPGTVYLFDATDVPVPDDVFGTSTHAFGVGQTIELARALGRLSCRVLVYGIVGEDFSPGEHLSPAVEAALATAAEQMLADITRPARLGTHQSKEQSHA